MDYQRQLLDELMGKDRNAPLDRQDRHFGRRMTDDDVCRYHLAGLCPYGLFKNTRWDLGTCGFKWHDDRLQQEFMALPDDEKNRLGFEYDLLEILRGLVRECDRNVEKALERAKIENAPKPLSPEETARLEAIDAEIAEAVAQATRLGEEGDVDGSEEAMKRADALKARREQEYRAMIDPPGKGRGILEVCMVSGVFMNTLDSESRRADHYNGKQYLGWKTIRDGLKELEDRLKDRKPRPAKEADAPKRERSRSRERERPATDRDRERPREGDRDRDRDRDGRRDRDRDYRRDDRPRSDGRSYGDRGYGDRGYGDRGYGDRGGRSHGGYGDRGRDARDYRR